MESDAEAAASKPLSRRKGPLGIRSRGAAAPGNTRAYRCTILMDPDGHSFAVTGIQLFLFARLHQSREGSRTLDEGRNLDGIQFAFEAQATEAPLLPSDRCATTKRSAVEYRRGALRQNGRAIHLGAAEREIEDLHGIAIPVGLKEGRQRDGRSRIKAPIRIGSSVSTGRNRTCHNTSLARCLSRRLLPAGKQRLGASPRA